MDTNTTPETNTDYPVHHEDPIIHPVGANIAKKVYVPDAPLVNPEETQQDA
jgi:hypothetical protein